MGKVGTGDLGTSYRYNQPVTQVISSRFPVSLYYGLITLIITYLVCIPLGVLKAIKHRTVVDNVTSILIFVGYAIPGYALGSLLLLYFSVKLEWFPMGGFTSMQFAEKDLWGKVADLAQHSALPLICYLVGSFALVTLLLKNHLMDNLAADYIRTAKAKGLSNAVVIGKHTLRNALNPVLTSASGWFAGLLAGSVLVETVVDYKGLGSELFDSLLNLDLPVLMGIVLFIALVYVAVNILTDIGYALLDPRVSYK